MQKVEWMSTFSDSAKEKGEEEMIKMQIAKMSKSSFEEKWRKTFSMRKGDTLSQKLSFGFFKLYLSADFFFLFLWQIFDLWLQGFST